MNINALLQGVPCTCGRTHRCDIGHVYIEDGAIGRLTELCQKYRSVLLVADTNTFLAAGEPTVAALSQKTVGRVIFDGSQLLIPNEEAIARVEAALGTHELIVGIGSGVIQDLCKYVAHVHSLPYMIVATAPSMDGYASTGAAMITGGMKVTYPAGIPEAILADPEVLANAPMEMIKAGYGDIIGKFSALNDWKLSRAVNGEYFCRYIYDTTYEMIEKTMALADGLLLRSKASVKVLMEALVAVGIMMSFAGSSRPASGSEHHLSHFFEITGILEGKPYLAHGIDVAYSTVITAKIREGLLNTPYPVSQYRETEEERNEAIKGIYGSAAEGCIALQKRIGNYARDRAPIYREKQEEIRKILAEMPRADEIERILSAVGLDMQEFYAFYGKKKIEDAVHYAKELKDRYTVLWMNYDLFGRND